MVYKTIRDQFENWMIKHFFRPLAEKNGLYKMVKGRKKYILPTISWYKSLDIEERDQERKLYYDMWKAGIISTETLFGKFPDLDFSTEGIKLEKERGTIFDKGDKRLPQGPVAKIKEGVPGAPEFSGEDGPPAELGGEGVSAQEGAEAPTALEAPEALEAPMEAPTAPEAPAGTVT